MRVDRDRIRSTVRRQVVGVVCLAVIWVGSPPPSGSEARSIQGQSRWSALRDGRSPNLAKPGSHKTSEVQARIPRARSTQAYIGAMRAEIAVRKDSGQGSAELFLVVNGERVAEIGIAI